MLHRPIIQSRWFRLGLGLILTGLIGVLVISAVSGDRLLLSPSAEWTVIEDFALEGEFPPNDPERRAQLQAQHPGIELWGSWTEDDRHTGRLASPSFSAPPILSLYVSGYPTHPRNHLFLKQTDSDQRYPLQIIADAREQWVIRDWLLPPTWWGKSIRIIASDRARSPGGWLGISTPLQRSFLHVLQAQLSTLQLIPLCFLYLAFVLLPGLVIVAIGTVRSTNEPMPQAFTVSLSLTLTAVISYGVFWVYWLNRWMGIALSLLLILGSCFFALRLYRRHPAAIRRLLCSQDVWLPIALMGTASLFYLTILYGVNPSVPAEDWVQFRFFEQMKPPDNVLPKLFADKLYAGIDLQHTPLLDDWLSSDRPPLQTGLVLLYRPFMLNVGLDYQVLATLLQNAWIPAVWALCRVIGLSGRQMAIVLLCCLFSGFFLFNAVYPWPKLLAAAFVLLGLTVLLRAKLADRPTTTAEVGLAALTIALGYLSHSGVVFLVPALLPLVIRFQNRFQFPRLAIVGCLVLVLMISPWSAYQKFYNPPGNRLSKWHLAGVIPIDDRSTTHALLDSYAQLTPAQWLSNKQQNIAALFSPPAAIGNAKAARDNNFFRTFNSLGILNLGWLVFGYRLWRVPNQLTQQVRALSWLLGISMAGLLIWIGVLFIPGSTAIHHGSYATMTALFVSLASYVSQLPNWIVGGVIGLQILSFATIWLFTTPPVPLNAVWALPNLPALCVGTIAAMISVILCIQLWNDRSNWRPLKLETIKTLTR